MATTRTTSKDDGKAMMVEFNRDWREGEQALLRLHRNTAERGDGIRLAKVGLNDLGRQKPELDRVVGVSIRLVKAGTSKQFREARDTFHETEPRCQAAMAHCDSEIQRLEQERAAVIDERRRNEAELENATNALRAMEAARELLRSPVALPPHIVAELNARRRAVATETGERRQQLSELISTLNADAGRLAAQTNGHGDVENEKLLEQFAERAAANATHRGHEFWVDRVYSLAEWRNYEAWASARAAGYQTELDELKSAAAAKLADEIEELSGFYLVGIE